MATFRNETSLIGDKWLLNEAFTCSKLAIETPKTCEICPKLTIKTRHSSHVIHKLFYSVFSALVPGVQLKLTHT